MKAELVLGNLKREREALDNKLERIGNALNKEWQDTDQEYLCAQQFNAMSLYAHILDERIADIEMKLEERKLAQKEETCKDKFVFKDKVDLGSCREDYDNRCPEDCKDCNPDPCDDILDILEEVFDIRIIR